MNEVESFLNNGFCVGCGLCKSIFNNRIDLKIDYKGKNKICLHNLEDNELNWFEKYCPAINLYDIFDVTRNNNIIFGPYINCYLGNSTNDLIRYSASTGGIVTSLMMYLLDQNIVNAVIHIGKDKINPFLNCTLVSKNSKEIRENIIGSRYSPTCLLSNINNILTEYKRIAIVGKGCEIRAIDKLLKDSDFNENDIYKIAIFCGGTPSCTAINNICLDFHINKNEIKDIRFRGNGWPGKFVISKKDNTQFKMDYRDSWVNYLSKELPLGCKLCFDGLSNFSDISTGDAWYGARKDGYPSFEEKDGRNLILARTEKGKELLLKAEQDNVIHLESIDVDEKVELMQPSQAMRRRSAYYKILALRLMKFKYPIVNKKMLKITKDKNCSNIKKIKYVLGMMKRVYNQKR